MITLITGASSGIGEAFAQRLAKEKHDLILVARSEEKLRKLCDELKAKHGIEANFVAADLLDAEADKRLFEEIQRRGLEIDCLINNAGFGSMGDFVDLNLERELEMIGLNIMALVALTHRFLPGMRRRKRGIIINVSSAASFQPLPYMATYAATKAFVTSFSEALSEENRAHGIQILNLCPGATETKFFENALIKDPLKIKGMQTAEEVVEAAMRGIARRKSRVISGWINFASATIVNVIPNRLITKVVGSALRTKLSKKSN